MRCMLLDVRSYSVSVLAPSVALIRSRTAALASSGRLEQGGRSRNLRLLCGTTRLTSIASSSWQSIAHLGAQTVVFIDTIPNDPCCHRLELIACHHEQHPFVGSFRMLEPMRQIENIIQDSANTSEEPNQLETDLKYALPQGLFKFNPC